MPDRFSNLPLELQQRIALQRFELDFGPPLTYRDAYSGLLVLRVPAVPLFVPPEQAADNPVHHLALILQTRAADVVAIDCSLKACDSRAFHRPGDATLLLFDDLLRRLPPESVRFIKHDDELIQDEDVEWDFRDSALARRWAQFKPALRAFLYLFETFEYLDIQRDGSSDGDPPAGFPT